MIKSKSIINGKIIISLFLLFSLIFFLPFTNAVISSKTIFNTYQDLHFQYEFDDVILTQKDDDLWEVKIEGLSKSNDYDKPKLPVKSINILLPYATSIKNIKITSPQTQLVKNGIEIVKGTHVVPLSPMKLNSEYQNLEKKQSDVKDSTPTPQFEIIGINKFRGFSILSLNLYPVQFQQKSGELVFSKQLNIDIQLKDFNREIPLRFTDDDKELVSKKVVNPKLINTYEEKEEFNGLFSKEEYKYVVITGEKFTNIDDEFSFEYFIEYKNNKGVTATIVTVEDIINNPDYSVDGLWGDNNPDNPFYQTPIINDKDIFDDTQARIRNFIRYAHMNWGTDYILLAGDSDTNNPNDIIVPHRGLFADERGLPLHGTLAYETDDLPSDVYYACLDGNFNYDCDTHFGEAPKFNSLDDSIDEADLFAEVWVGRACVDSKEEVSNFVQKTVKYDQLFYDDYFSRILFLGEYLGQQFFSPWGGGYKDLIEPIIPDEYNLTKLYERDGTFDPDYYWYLLNEEPPLIINHDGHGSPTSAMKLTCRSIEQLTNDKYYFIYSHTCLAGSFDNCWPPDTYYSQDCVAEYFTVEIPHGAIGVVMNSRYGLGSEDSLESPSGAYDESFFKGVFEQNIRNLGPANHYAKEDHIWEINENGMRWAYYETNLFGDPEISIKNPKPNVNVDLIITKPVDGSVLYINDGSPIQISFLTMPFIIGGITISVEATTQPEKLIDSVSFNINNVTEFIDDTEPYEYFFDTSKKGIQEIKIIAQTIYEDYAEEKLEIFNLW